MSKPDELDLRILVRRLRLLEQDHLPHGYPPVRMAEITALLDALGLDEPVLDTEAQETITRLQASRKIDRKDLLEPFGLMSTEHSDPGPL